MTDKNFLEDQRAFYGIPDLYLCPRCTRGTFHGSSGNSGCNHCIGAGVLMTNGEPPE